MKLWIDGELKQSGKDSTYDQCIATQVSFLSTSHDLVAAPPHYTFPSAMRSYSDERRNESWRVLKAEIDRHMFDGFLSH